MIDPVIITTSVGCDDLLEITLPRMRALVNRVVVVTTPEDVRSQDVAALNDCVICQTNEFHVGGAEFNKYAAVNHAIRSVHAIDPDAEWILQVDSDIVLPEEATSLWLDSDWHDPEVMYGANRRVLDPVPLAIPEDWSNLPFARHNEEPAGFFQLFSLDSSTTRKHGLYPGNYKTSAGPDSFFWQRFPRVDRVPFDVLHLGAAGTGYCGRTNRRIDGTLPEGARKNWVMWENYRRIRLERMRHGAKGEDVYISERL